MKIIKACLLVILFVSFLYFGFIFIKKNTLRPSLDMNTLVVGVCNNCPPYMYMNENKLIGYDIDFITELASRMTKYVSFKILSDDALDQALYNGDVHIACRRPSHINRDNRIIISPQYKGLESSIFNTIEECKEDGTIEDLTQRWSCNK